LAVIHQFLELLKKQLSAEPSKNLNFDALYSQFGEFIDNHALHPIFIEGCENEQNTSNSAFLDIKKQVGLSNLMTKVEAKRVLTLLNSKGIDVLPYKGHVFISILYNQKPLRLTSDLDLLFDSTTRAQGMAALLEDGYEISGDNILKDNNFQTIFNAIGMNEIPLQKPFHNQYHTIDFHWDFAFNFLPYNLPFSNFFEGRKSFEIDGQQYLGPSDQAILYMIAIHHGGRDAWTSLKLVVDVHAYMAKFGTSINWESCFEKLAEMKLLRATLTGLFLAHKYLDTKVPKVVLEAFEKHAINETLTKPILNYWQNGYNILSAKGRFNYEKILISIQDPGFSVWKYYYKMFQTYGIPNPIETPRLITFPQNWYTMNALSKLVTYLYKRAFGKIIR
jgi:hypothetical protein